MKSEPELLDVVFRLLGNSTEDLFFPRNYVVVEGASDQRLVERALDLLGAEPGQIKVLSASGISGVDATVYAVERQLLPMIISDSPYAQRVVAMIDEPREAEQERVRDLERHLDDRLVQLPAPSLEEYVPARLYEVAGLDRDAALERIRNATTFSAKRDVKREISETLASALTEELLNEIPEIRRVAELALSAQ